MPKCSQYNFRPFERKLKDIGQNIADFSILESQWDNIWKWTQLGEISAPRHVTEADFDNLKNWYGIKISCSLYAAWANEQLREQLGDDEYIKLECPKFVCPDTLNRVFK